MYNGHDPNTHTAAVQPRTEPADAWSVHDRQLAPEPIGSDSEKYLSWDGSQPLICQLPDNAHIRTLITYAATTQNVSVFAGAGIAAQPLLSTSGAAGTFRIPRGHAALTLVSAAPFGEVIPVYITAVPLNPTVALQEVNVTLNSGIPANAVQVAAEGQFGITGPGTTNLSFTPAIPIGPYALCITFADIAFDAALTSPAAIMLQQNVASLQIPLMVLTTGFNARSYTPGLNAPLYASAILINASIKAIGAGIAAGEIYYNVLGYYLKI